MNIYLVEDNTNLISKYDISDSFIVIEDSEESAIRTHPSGWEDKKYSDENKCWVEKSGERWKILEHSRDNDWPNEIEKLSVKLIGKAAEGSEKGVVLSSFNRG